MASIASLRDLAAASSHWAPAIFALVAAFAVHALAMPLFRRERLRGKHVFITGGSKGIGLALALEFVRRGCSVSVAARSPAALAQALAELTALAKSLGLSPSLQALSADTASEAELAAALGAAEAAAGPVDVLVCCAGVAVPGLFVEQDVAVFQRQMEVNYLGSVRAVKCALPGMLARGRGQVVLVASVVGFAGYASYAPTKWALRGLADCLHNEVSRSQEGAAPAGKAPVPKGRGLGGRPAAAANLSAPDALTAFCGFLRRLQLQGTGVRISVAYPPDTDTPGHAQENLTKPAICHAVNAALGSQLFPAGRVAARMVGQLERGAYHLNTPDPGSNLLISAMTGLAPKSVPTALGVLLAPVLQVVTTAFGAIADRAARRCNRERGYPPASGSGGAR